MNNNNQYLIAANSKRAQLIFNVFRPIDLAIALIGLTITVILFVVIQPSSLWLALITLFPLLFCAFLVLPIPNYQNVLCVLQNIYNFYFNDQRQYIWKGWGAKYEFK